MSIESIVAELRQNQWTVPQPEGSEVAEAYRAGVLTADPVDLMHIIAVLLHRSREARGEV